MIRAVYDTNILVSGTVIASQSPPAHIVDAAVAGHVQLVSSAVLIDEYLDVLSRPKFAKRLASIGKTAEELVYDYIRMVEIVDPVAIPRIADDPDDDHVLACAMSGRAAYVVSGDDHLLSIGHYQSIQICTARAFLDMLNQAL